MCEETEPWQMQFRHNKTAMSKTRTKQENPEVLTAVDRQPGERRDTFAGHLGIT